MSAPHGTHARRDGASRALDALAAAVCAAMGWADGESLRQRLAQAVQELGRAGDPTDPAFVRAVAERATVNETYFYRHPEQLGATCAELEQAFPGATLRCWSAGCSTGEEPYSLAMQLLRGGLAPGRLEVLGTDVSARALELARAGRYPEWSFRGLPRAVREDCFSRVADAAPGVPTFEVRAAFREPVRFERHNLLSPPPMDELHLVACRNALIYFEPGAVQRVLRHLESALRPGGYLMLGAAEQHLAGALGFETVLRAGVVLLRKPLARVRPAAPEPALAAPAPVEPAPPPPPPAPARDPVQGAWEALRAGGVAEARAFAEDAAAAQRAEAHLVLAALDEAEGRVPLALEHLRRAIYLDPTLVCAHAAQAALFQRLGRARDSSRARANALRHLKTLAPETLLCGIHPLTARELRDALESP